MPYSAYTFTSSLGTLTSAGALNVSISAANSLTNSVTLYTLNLTGGADVSIGSGNPTITLLGGGLIGNTSNGSNGITSGGTLEGSPSGELVVITPQNLTISSVIANNGGATALTKTGPATLILSGINTYSGATTVAAGVLQISNTAALGNSTSINDYGTLAFNSSAPLTYGGMVTGGGNIAVSGAGAVTLTNTSNTFAGVATISAGSTLQAGDGLPIGSASNVVDNGSLVFSHSDSSSFLPAISGSGTLTQTGTGSTLTLLGASTYTGSTVIASGTLALGSLASLGAGGSYSGAIANSGALALNISGTQFLSGALTGNGQLIQGGPGITVLTGINNTYSGGTTISGGTLQVGYGGIGLLGPEPVTDNAALVYDLLANATFNGVISGSGSLAQMSQGSLFLTASNTFSGGATISSGSVSITGSGSLGSGPAVDNAWLAWTPTGTATGPIAISGGGGLSLSGSGLLILPGSNTYSGSTNIAGGTLQVGNGTSGEFLASSIVTVGSNAWLAFNHADALSYSGAIAGSGGLLNAGTGVLTLLGSNIYTGVTSVAGGTLLIGGTGSLGANSTYGGAIALSNSGVLAFATSSNQWLSGVISGTGGLSQAGPGILVLTGSSTFTGNSTIFGGTIQVGSGGTAGVLPGPVADYGTLAFNVSGSTTFGGAISGSGGMTQLGPGTLFLTNSNAFSGNTVIAGGSLSLVNPNALQNSTVVLTTSSSNSLLFNASGGTLFTIGGLSGIGGVVLGNTGAVTLDVGNSTNSTFSGVLSGSGGLNVIGSGILTLTGTNTYKGGTTLTAGELSISASTALPNNSIVFNGGTLQVTGLGLNSMSPYGGNVNWSTFNGGFDIANPANIFLVNSSIGGSGNLSKLGPGTLLLTATNNYANTTIQAGTLEISGTATLGTGPVADNGTLFLYSLSGSPTIANSISGSGGLNLSGPGTVVLTASNTFTGPTGISGGTLQVGNGASGEFLASSGVTLSGSGAALVFSHSDALTYGGAVNGNGGLVQTGASLLTLSGSNTYTGPTTVAGGTLQVGNGSSGEYLASASVSLASGAAMVFNNADVLTYGGAISGSGTVTQLGTGITILSGSNIYSGGTILLAGELSISSSANLPAAGPLTFSGGVLQITGTALNSMAGFSNVKWSSFSGGFDIANAANAFTVGSALSGSGGLTELGPGTLVLTASNTYTGATTILAGTLQVSGSGALGSGPVTDDSALLFSPAGSTIVSGIISGPGSLTQAGPGTLVLTGSSLYTGLTTISGGTLQVGNGRSGASIDGTSGIVDNGSLVFNDGDVLTLAAQISGSGNLTQAGPGVLVLTASNTGTGPTFVLGGTLQVGNGGSGEYLTSPSVGLSNGASLVFNHADALTYSGAIGGTGSVAKLGPGILTLTGTNTYSGATTLSAGELSISTTSNLPVASLIVFNGGVLQVTGTSLTSLSAYGNVNWTSFNGGFDIASANNTFTLASPIGGTGGLSAVGAVLY